MLKTGKVHQKIGWILFVGYMLVMLDFMFFSDAFGRTGRGDYAYNLVLFREIKRFYLYRHQLGIRAFLLNIAGNVLCFMPFGFFLPVISRWGESCFRTVLTSALVSLSIETVQLFFQVGSFDVDDMFLNTLGGLAGYIVFRAMLGMHRRMGGGG